MAFPQKWVNSTSTPTYNSWRSMRNRILYDSSDSHKFYKEKGIIICQQWVDSFDVFVSDMGLRPQGTTLDRINPNGNYEPNNCRWADMRIQQNNKFGLTAIEKDGVIKTIGEWGFDIDLTEREMNTVYKRYSAHGAKTYDELFCENLYSFRKSLEKHRCLVCGTTESKKWRKSACANCYARALRYFKKVDKPVDIAGYATLIDNELVSEKDMPF